MGIAPESDDAVTTENRCRPPDHSGRRLRAGRPE